ncbi:MAG: T9SS type A sorting domain-containing protein [Flavobacterium sp.]
MMKKLLLLFCLVVLSFSYAQTELRFANNFTTGFIQYAFPSTDVAYRDEIGTTFANGNTNNVCSGALRRTQLSTVILELKSSAVSEIVVHGTSSGSSVRTLTNIETSTTLGGTYTSIPGYSTNSTISTTSCGTISVSNINIPINTFVRFTFSGNVNLSGFDLTVAGDASEPTSQTNNISFSSVTSSSFTVNWTNGNGNNRAVFVKEGAQGTISNPVDGEVYTASSNWNSGTPSATQLGTSGYYCVYNGNSNTVSLTNLNPETTYWVQAFEYNGVGAGTNYLTDTATNNPNSQATDVAPVVYYFRSITTGNWNETDTWEMSIDNASWSSATLVPDFENSQSIVIRENHEVSIVSGTVVIDQLVVDASAKLIVNAGATISINNGSGDDVVVNGTLEFAGVIASASGSAAIINGVFENKINSATFSAGSGTMAIAAGGTYRINGYTGTASYGLTNVSLTQGIGALGSNYEVLTGAPRLNNAQTYGNVIWNSPIQGGSFLNNPTANVSGNFHLISTSNINHGAGGSGRTLNIAGDLIIDGGTYEISGAGATTSNTLNVTGNVVVNGGQFLMSNSTIIGGVGNLNASGNITLNGGFFGLPENITTGNFNLNGTAAPQTIAISEDAEASVRNININNNNGITLSGSGTLDVKEIVSFGNINNAILNAGGVLRLLSTNNLTARIADITNNNVNSGNTISGNVIAQRFIPQGKRAFRFVTPGVNTSDFISNNWQLATHITGSTSGANGFDASNSGSVSMFSYNNQVASGTGWTAIAGTNNTNLFAGHGYRILIRGDRNVNLNAVSQDNMNNAVTLTAKGSVLTGTIIYNELSSPAINNTTNPTTDSYSLVGNPYLSSVDWHALSKTGLEDVYYAWDANLGTSAQRGRYVAYSQTAESSSVVNGSGSTNVGRYIQSGQAFFVKNSTAGTPGTLVFNENNKVSNQAMLFKSSNNSVNSDIGKLYVTLFETEELSNGFAIDGSLAVIGNSFTTSFGAGDVKKLESSGSNVMFLRDNNKLAIEAIGIPQITDELQIIATNLVTNKNYSWKLDVSSIPSGITPYLYDSFTNTSTLIDQAQLVSNFTTSNVQSSISENRFKIIFNNTPLGLNQSPLNQLSLYPNPSNNEVVYLNGIQLEDKSSYIQVYNAIGQEIPVILSNIGNNQVKLTAKYSLQSGLYLISVNNGQETKKLKWIVN